MQQAGNITQVNGKTILPGLQAAAPVSGISTVFDDVLSTLLARVDFVESPRVEPRLRDSNPITAGKKDVLPKREDYSRPRSSFESKADVWPIKADAPERVSEEPRDVGADHVSYQADRPAVEAVSERIEEVPSEAAVTDETAPEPVRAGEEAAAETVVAADGLAAVLMAAVADETAPEPVRAGEEAAAETVVAADGLAAVLMAAAADETAPEPVQAVDTVLIAQVARPVTADGNDGSLGAGQDAQQTDAQRADGTPVPVSMPAAGQAETPTTDVLSVGQDTGALLSDVLPKQIDPDTAGQVVIMPEGAVNESAPPPGGMQAEAAPNAGFAALQSDLIEQPQTTPHNVGAAHVDQSLAESVPQGPQTFVAEVVETNAQAAVVEDTAAADVDEFVPSASDDVVNKEARSADPKLNPAKPDSVFVNPEARQTAGEPVKAPDTAPVEVQGGFNGAQFEAPEAFAHTVSYDAKDAQPSGAAPQFQDAPQAGPAEVNVPVTNGEAEGRTMFFDGRGSAGSDNGAAAQVRSEAVGQGSEAQRGEFARELGEARGIPRADQVETIEKIVKTMSMAVRRGESEVRILLQPPRLGSVRIKLSVKNGVLNATFETQNQAARHVISNSLPHLKAALESQGIEVEGFNVTVEHEAGQPAFTDEREPFGNFSQAGFFSPESEEEEDYDPFAEKQRMAAGTSLVDYFV